MSRFGVVGLVEKPVGPSSFARLNEVVGAPGDRTRPRACHGGTLDPFAEGLLLVLVDWGTHLFEGLHRLPKTYDAEVVWGVETDNGDPTGAPVAEAPAPTDTAALDVALGTFLGWSEQVPPATSAKKVRGEPAWRRVHRGEVVELPPSRVYLHAAAWVSHDLPRRSRLVLTCAGGFYVRALVRDLARSLGARAHLARLRRTVIGPYTLEDAPSWRHGLAAAPWLPTRVLDDAEWGRLRRRAPIPRGTPLPPAWTAPAGFPPGADLALGVHLGAPVALLGGTGADWAPRATWRRG